MTYVELEILDPLPQKSRINRFIAQMFPSECHQYLVPTSIYDYKLSLYQKCSQEGQLLGRRFKTHLKDKLFSGHEVKVISVSPIEPDHLSESQWTSIVVQEVEQSSLLGSGRHNRRNNRQDPTEVDPAAIKRINFWDLVYPNEKSSMSEIAFEHLPRAFDDLENQRLVDVVTMFIQRKVEHCVEFLDRVSDDIAADYKCYIPHEMWLNLILERLQTKYYRSEDQMWSDLDLISFCSFIYNGDEELTQKARAFVEKLRKELKQYISYNKEKQLGNRKPNSIVASSNKPGIGLGFAHSDQNEDETNNLSNMISLNIDQDPQTEVSQKKPSTKLGKTKKFSPVQGISIGQGGG